MTSYRSFRTFATGFVVAIFTSFVIADSFVVACLQDQKQDAFFKIDLPSSFDGLKIAPDGKLALVWQSAAADVKAVEGGAALPINDQSNSVALVDLQSKQMVKTNVLDFEISKAIIDADYVYVLSADKLRCEVLNNKTLKVVKSFRPNGVIHSLVAQDGYLRLGTSSFSLPSLEPSSPNSGDTRLILASVKDVSLQRSRNHIVSIQAEEALNVPANAEKGKQARVKKKMAKPNKPERREPKKRRMDSWPFTIVGQKRVFAENGKFVKSLAILMEFGTDGQMVELNKVDAASIIATDQLLKLEYNDKHIFLLNNNELWVCDVMASLEPRLRGPVLTAKMDSKKRKSVTKPAKAHVLKSKSPSIDLKPRLISSSGTTVIPFEWRQGERPYQFANIGELPPGVSLETSGVINVDHAKLNEHCQQRFIDRLIKQYSVVKGMDQHPSDFLDDYDLNVAQPLKKLAGSKVQGLPVRVSVQFEVVDANGKKWLADQQLYTGAGKELVLAKVLGYFKSRTAEAPFLVAKSKESQPENRTNARPNGLSKSQADKLNQKKREAIVNKVQEMESQIKKMEQELKALKALLKNMN